MEENKTVGGDASERGDLTVVPIPEDKAQAVLEFIQGLESEDAEVSGHMLSRSLVGGLGALSARTTKHRTDTGCVQTTTGVGVDFNCSDSDTIYE